MKTPEEIKRLDAQARQMKLSGFKGFAYRVAEAKLRYMKEYKCMMDGKPVIITR